MAESSDLTTLPARAEDEQLAASAYQDSLRRQSESPLIAKLPPEIRNEIFTYVLQQHHDPTKEFDKDTPYKRPEQQGKRTVHTALLRTCKAVHYETWFLPWTNLDLFIYLTSDERAPKDSTSIQELSNQVQRIFASHGEELISHVYVYAQLYKLEQSDMAPLLQIPHFSPEIITLTIRHADWWRWEFDEELYLGADWVAACEFPDSIREFQICFESLKRKTDQIKSIAAKAKAEWFFRRQDGTVLSAEGSESKIKYWTGSSTWMGKRWIRDEERVDELDFYCETVTWRPAAEWPAEREVPLANTLRSDYTGRVVRRVMNVNVDDLIEMGLEGATADEIEERVMARRMHNRRMVASRPQTGIRYV